MSTQDANLFSSVMSFYLSVTETIDKKVARISLVIEEALVGRNLNLIKADKDSCTSYNEHHEMVKPRKHALHYPQVQT